MQAYHHKRLPQDTEYMQWARRAQSGVVELGMGMGYGEVSATIFRIKLATPQQYETAMPKCCVSRRWTFARARDQLIKKILALTLSQRCASYMTL